MGDITYEYFNINFGSGGWIAGIYLDLSSVGNCGGTPPICPKIISRAEWGARPPTYTVDMALPVPRYFVHHTATSDCFTQANCMSLMRAIQGSHIDVNGWPDIGFTFLVGEDGNVYEGRGWDHEPGMNNAYASTGYDVGIFGDFTLRDPSVEAMELVLQLIECGLSLNKISQVYVLHGHADAICTQCPGNSFYRTVQTWPRYGGKLPGSCTDSDLQADHSD